MRIELWTQEVTSVSELTQDFEIGWHLAIPFLGQNLEFPFSDLYVNEFWEDPALSYDYLRPCKGNLSFDHTFLKTIWQIFIFY